MKAVGLRLATSMETDLRLNLLAKLVEGVRTIKAYAWELPILRSIKAQRAKEIRRTCLLYLVLGFGEGIVRSPGILLWLPVLLIKITAGEYVEAAVLFPVMGILNMLGISVITAFFYSLNSTV